MSSLSEKRKVTVNGVEYEVEIQLDDGKWEVSIEASERTVILTEEGGRVQDLFPQRFQEK